MGKKHADAETVPEIIDRVFKCRVFKIAHVRLSTRKNKENLTTIVKPKRARKWRFLTYADFSLVNNYNTI